MLSKACPVMGRAECSRSAPMNCADAEYSQQISKGFNVQVVNAMVDQSFHSKQKEGQDPSSAISQTIEQFSAFHPPRSPGLCPHLRYILICIEKFLFPAFVF